MLVKAKATELWPHMNGALDFEGVENEASEKIGIIRDIHKSGLDAIHVIHRHGLNSDGSATSACKKVHVRVLPYS